MESGSIERGLDRPSRMGKVNVGGTLRYRSHRSALVGTLFFFLRKLDFPNGFGNVTFFVLISYLENHWRIFWLRKSFWTFLCELVDSAFGVLGL